MNGKYAQIIANIIMNKFLADSLLVEFFASCVFGYIVARESHYGMKSKPCKFHFFISFQT